MIGVFWAMSAISWFSWESWMFVLGVLFQVITLPVEFNAFARSIRLLGDSGDFVGSGK